MSQLNKSGREFTDLSALKQSLENKYHFPIYCKIEDKKYERFRVGYFCNHCGIEFQGIWKENYLQLNHTGHSCHCCQEHNQCEALKKTLEEEREKLSSIYYQTHTDELKILSKLTHCPVCGAELLRKTGYFFSE